MFLCVDKILFGCGKGDVPVPIGHSGLVMLRCQKCFLFRIFEDPLYIFRVPIIFGKSFVRILIIIVFQNFLLLGPLSMEEWFLGSNSNWNMNLTNVLCYFRIYLNVSISIQNYNHLLLKFMDVWPKKSVIHPLMLMLPVCLGIPLISCKFFVTLF